MVLTALYRLHVNSWSVVENVIHSKGWSHNGDVVISCTALFFNKVCSFWLLASCKILLCEYDPFIVIGSVHSGYPIEGVAALGFRYAFFSVHRA